MNFRIDIDIDKFVSNYNALPSITSQIIKADTYKAFLLAHFIISKIEAQLVFKKLANMPRDAFAIGYIYGFAYKTYVNRGVISSADPRLDQPAVFAICLLLILDEFYDSKSLLLFFENGKLNDKKTAIFDRESDTFMLEISEFMIDISEKSNSLEDTYDEEIKSLKNFFDLILKSFEKKDLAGVPNKTLNIWRIGNSEKSNSFADGQHAGYQDCDAENGESLLLQIYITENKDELSNFYSITDRKAKSEFAKGLDTFLEDSYNKYLDSFKEDPPHDDSKQELDDKPSYSEIFWMAPLVAMGIGLLPMPYGYYFLSRLTVFLCSIYFALQLNKNNEIFLVWVFSFFALLYNPIIPIHLGSKGFWVVVNLVTAGVFIANKDKV